MKKITIAFLPVFSFLMICCGETTVAQVARDSELFISMQRHDSIFFEKGFNQCDTNFLKQATHPDLIFYHDLGGMQNKTVFLERVSKNLCSDWSNKPIRKVRKETLEVYPLYDNGKLYGVVQSGVHDFYKRVQGLPDSFSGTAKFTHVYLLVNGNWMLREVLSFDHK